MMTVEQRYQTDPVFHRLVDAIYDGISKGEFTPTEVREAAMLAMIKYETMRPPRPIVVSSVLMERLLGRQILAPGETFKIVRSEDLVRYEMSGDHPARQEKSRE